MNMSINATRSILQFFKPLLSYHLSLKIFVLSIYEWQLKTGFTVVLVPCGILNFIFVLLYY